VIKDDLTLYAALQTEDFQNLFHLPLSEHAFEQFNELHTYVVALQQTEMADKWTYIWGNAIFSSVKTYKQLSGFKRVDPAHTWLWKSSCQQKHKVFFWLLINDRLNTRGLLRRKNMVLDSYACEMCILQREESLRHLLFRCNFAKNCWASIGIFYPLHLQPLQIIKRMKRSLHVSFYMEVIILMSWNIWTQRNNWLFNEVYPSVQRCKNNFKKDFSMLIHRAKKKYFPRIELWLQQIS